jgi:hypothetical protein
MFAFVIMTGFAGPLEEEGYIIELKSAAAGFVSSFFQNRSVEEQAGILQQASGAFVQMHHANVPSVADWQKQVRQAAQLYVLQFTTEDEELKKKDLRPFFGGLLKSLLALVE